MATQTQLDEARAAYHKLLTGKSVVSINVDGVQTTYEKAQISSLKAYIESLEAALGATSTRRRPFGVY